MKIAEQNFDMWLFVLLVSLLKLTFIQIKIRRNVVESVKMILNIKAFDFHDNRLVLNLFNEIISISWITLVVNFCN